MAVPYLSKAWAERALALVEADERVLEAVRGAPLSVLTIVLHPPRGAYGFFYVAFDEAGLCDYRVGHDYTAVTQGIDEATFVVSGEYEVFARVHRGKLSPRRAFMGGGLHLAGPPLKALRRRKALEALHEALQQIECTT